MNWRDRPPGDLLVDLLRPYLRASGTNRRTALRLLGTAAPPYNSVLSHLTEALDGSPLDQEAAAFALSCLGSHSVTDYSRAMPPPTSGNPAPDLLRWWAELGPIGTPSVPPIQSCPH